VSANHLGAAASAYLRSAAHQPVHWYPWSTEAFDAARTADRPVLLDVGAVWCHWCHVMDGESYEDPDLAEFLNANFVCVKVDRDERPDVDARYQRAVQALTRQGGWPLTAFLTPGGDVFYGGTYFPPDNGHGRPGFRAVLEAVLDAYRNRRHQVVSQAEAIRRAVTAQLDEPSGGTVTAALLDAAELQILNAFDPAYGGFGREPKFPHPGALLFLLSRWFDAPSDGRREAVDRTLEAMARGGMHDQLGGGFHRYSVDRQWIVPHFEKMSYDNSELLRIYTEAFAAFGTPEYADVARGIMRWVRDVLAEDAGGYAASQDADVGLEDDGDYFTWTRDEAAAVLTPDELDVASAVYDIGTAGEMHHNPGKNVLFIAATASALAMRSGRTEDEITRLLSSARGKLLHAREQRPTPFVDRSRYTGWNAMMASAMLRGSVAFDDPWAAAHALRTLERIRAENPDPDAVAHTPGGVTGLLDDQVQTAAAAIDAYEFTGSHAWVDWAGRIMNRVWSDYRDPRSGGLFDSANAAGEGLLPARSRPLEDSPTPSGNGTAGIVLSRLHELTGDARWRDRADELLTAFAGRAAELGLYAATYFQAVDRLVQPATHLAVVGGSGDPDAERMHQRALRLFAPRRVVQRIDPADVGTRHVPPAVSGMIASSAGARAFLCRGMSCSAPADTDGAWERTLADFSAGGRQG
jgi:uncharacterized protein